MRLQKEKSSSSLLVVMIVLSSLVIGYGIFRLLAFKPVLMVDDVVLKLLGKFSMRVSLTTKEINHNIQAFLHSPKLQKELEHLEYENRLLKIQIALNQNWGEENSSLKKLLGLLNVKDYTFTPCDIWFRDQDNPMNFTINKGKIHHLTREQGIVYPLELKHPMIIQYQLIGRIQELNQNSSRVLSILDVRSKISSRNLRTKALGTVQYDKEKKMLFLLTPSENDDYAINDIMVTSDLSSVPRNLVIGIVQKIEPTSSINKKVILGTTIDFLKLTSAAAIK